MKKTQFVFLGIILLISCKSKEDKANELIKESLFKTLYDFSSYEPIETIIDSAFTSIYQDSLVTTHAILLLECITKSSSYLEKSKSAQSSVEIWSNSYSSYGQLQYKRARDEFTSNIDLADYYIKKAGDIQNQIKEEAENFQSVFMGWQAKHKFRCKTRGGAFDLGDYIYVIDEDFEKILHFEDSQDKDLKEIRNIIDEAITSKSNN